MTDKELKKLSRLELLELLLEVSKENEKLKEKIEKLQIENKTAQNIENLSVITQQVENALEYANSLTYTLETKAGVSVTADSSTKQYKAPAVVITEPLSDKEIYLHILSFFAKNDDKLNVLPADIRNNVRARIRNILNKRNTK